MEQNLNKYVKKAHINAIAKFNAELAEFAKYTGESPPTLYEDIFTPFTLWNIRLENGILYWDCDGKTEWSKVVLFDDEEQEYYEDDWMDGIPQAIRYWKSCLRKAKKYWQTDPDVLDRIYDEQQPDFEDPEDQL